jgi:uncharacterized protein YcbK (DUF882 family)
MAWPGFIHLLADSNGLSNLINWMAASVRAGEGIARDVTRLDRVSHRAGEIGAHHFQGGLGNLHSRRNFLRTGLAAASALAIPGVAWAGIRAPIRQVRSLGFYNLHTGESLKTVYYENGDYVTGALQEINYVLRDFRANEVKPIDPRLLDLLVELLDRLGTTAPYDVISGYRSPKTNAMLHASSEGVAVHSLHVDGRAIDIRVPNRDLSTLHYAALSLLAGGVGYYPRSDFVHVDTGRIRRW